MGYFSDFAQNMDWLGLANLLMTVVAVLLCLTVHEACHGLAAYALGDPTAKSQHRLSLNPLRHIDPIGTLMMIVAGFGWAKPVPVDMRYFKRPKSGMAVTALAGPLSNFVLAYVAMLLRSVCLAFYSPGMGLWGQGIDFFTMLAVLSVGLGIFNLIPFPPLDGSKIAESFLPDKLYYAILRYERWGMLILMLLLWFNVLAVPLTEARGWVLDVMSRFAAWPYYLLS